MVTYIMDFRFGPNKPQFIGTDDEWNLLQEAIAWWNEDTSNYRAANYITRCELFILFTINILYLYKIYKYEKSNI